MLPKINPTQTKAWKALQQHADEMKQRSIRELFEEDPERFSAFSLHFDDILVDFSKNLVSRTTLDHLGRQADRAVGSRERRQRDRGERQHDHDGQSNDE